MTRWERSLLRLLIVFVQLVGILILGQCAFNTERVYEVNNLDEKYETVDDMIKEVIKLDTVKRVDDWPYGIKFAVWNEVDESIPKSFDEGWLQTIEKLIEPGKTYLHSKADLTHYLDPGCNIVDIGANTGDTPLVLAVAAKGGTVVAFEMGPPIDMLRINKRFVEC